MTFIRFMERADIDELLAITATSPGAAVWSRLAYEALHADPARGRVLIAEEEGTVAGFVCFRILRQEAELLNLAVRPSFRRRGIGSQLVERALRDARVAGAARIFLEVRPSNLAALSLYERLGFQSCGRRTGYYTDPAEDALVLHRTLEPLATQLTEGRVSG